MSFLSLTQPLSIALFLTGFLLQYWNVITSFDLRAPILIFGGSFASFLAGLIAALHLLTTLHAIFYGRSLFENPFSRLIRKCVLWMRDLTRVRFRSKRTTDIRSTKKGNEDSDIENYGEPELGAVQQLLQRKAIDSEDTVARKTFARLIIRSDPRQSTHIQLLRQVEGSFDAAFGEWQERSRSENSEESRVYKTLKDICATSV
ncbi:hypothetical protein SISSUDRAFT_1046953 [Sistotremastrum suecicum HHB10207 ss-3]|uniref:Uncharacterized protein n=1 Tax=Sistotremastrum suecicum HHB10207 ss-3 TaxID=1314776 RepID=A0A166DGR0_9AGAM|nr:hypothetical protein SISSUDRAFT_1046953 [Sistotremastrum suecicum HHB10207 ss-3]